MYIQDYTDLVVVNNIRLQLLETELKRGAIPMNKMKLNG